MTRRLTPSDIRMALEGEIKMKKDKILEKRLKRFGKQIDKRKKEDEIIKHGMSLMIGILAISAVIMSGLEYYIFNDIPAAMVGVVVAFMFACSSIVVCYLEELLAIRTLEHRVMLQVVKDLYEEP